MTEGSAPQYRPSEEEEVAVGRIGLILFAAKFIGERTLVPSVVAWV
jgi:hypothetical protein